MILKHTLFPFLLGYCRVVKKWNSSMRLSMYLFERLGLRTANSSTAYLVCSFRGFLKSSDNSIVLGISDVCGTCMTIESCISCAKFSENSSYVYCSSSEKSTGLWLVNLEKISSPSQSLSLSKYDRSSLPRYDFCLRPFPPNYLHIHSTKNNWFS